MAKEFTEQVVLDVEHQSKAAAPSLAELAGSMKPDVADTAAGHEQMDVSIWKTRSEQKLALERKRTHNRS